jgi:hypothetical protein
MSASDDVTAPEQAPDRAPGKRPGRRPRPLARRPLRLAEGSRKYLRKAFPAHWSFLVGEVALFSLVVLLLTGTFLALFYTPDTTPVIYDGPYARCRAGRSPPRTTRRCGCRSRSRAGC